MEFIVKIVNGLQLLIIFAKRAILDILQGSEYASEKSLVENFSRNLAMAEKFLKTPLWWSGFVKIVNS